MLQEQLKNRPDLQKYLFIRGFLATDKKIENLNDFPFYGNWNETEKCGLYFYTHNKIKPLSILPQTKALLCFYWAIAMTRF